MQLIFNFLHYYSFNLATLIAFYTIGTFFYKALGIKSLISYKTTFFKIIIGLIFFTMSVAVFRTSGKTILIFLAIPLLIFFSYLKKQEKTDTTSVDEHTSTKEIIISSLLFCPYLLLFLPLYI